MSGAEVISKLKAADVKPFETKLKAQVGPGVKLTVKFEVPPAKTHDFPLVRDVGSYLAPAVGTRDFTRYGLDPILEAIKSLQADELGKRAVKDGLKEVVIYAAVGEGILEFDGGVLTIGNHVFSDAQGTRFEARDISTLMADQLQVDEPHVGRVSLRHARAIEALEKDDVAPFRAKVNALLGTPVKVTVRYDSPPGAEGQAYAVKAEDFPTFLTKAHNQLTIAALNQVLEALTEVMADDLGKKALRKDLKEVVVWAVVGEAFVDFKGGVLTSGSHIFGDGLGSSLGTGDLQKPIEWALIVDEPVTGTRVPLPQARAIASIEAKQVAPFRAKLTEAFGREVKLTVHYAPPASADARSENVKEPAKYLVRLADGSNLQYRLLNQLSEAFAEASKTLGKAALSARVKSVVLYPIDDDAHLTLENGVLTMSFGENSSYGSSDVLKLLGTR